MPKIDLLDDYYDNVYKRGKPHFIQNPEKIDIPIWQLAQYSYINQFIDIKLKQ